MASVVTTTLLGNGDIQVTIAQTASSDVEEVTIAGMPSTGRIKRQVTALKSGTGTTVDPIIGTVTDPGAAANSQNVVLENGTAAATTDNQPVGGACYHTDQGTLFYRSRPNNAAADHVIDVVLLVRTGWVA